MGKVNMLSKFRQKTIDWIIKEVGKINPRYSGELMYYRAFRRRMNLKEPKNLIEKIYWLQYYSDTSMWTLCADKFRMREYVESCGLSEYLPKLYGHWENPEDIDFDLLPQSFVLKSNNGCGTVKIVRDKSLLHKEATVKEMKQWLKEPYGYSGGQSHYLRIKPCIVAEELLTQDEAEKLFSPTSIADYKIWVLNGVPECIWVAFNRHNAFCVNMALFDTQWRPIPQYLKDTNIEIYDPKVVIPCPVCLDEMLELAKRIAKPFPELRLDFYVIGGKPYIGELTFTSGYGYYTDEYYEYLGNKLDIAKFQDSKGRG